MERLCLMKVLSYVIELLHVDQTVILARSASRHVTKDHMDIDVPIKGLMNSGGARAAPAGSQNVDKV